MFERYVYTFATWKTFRALQLSSKHGLVLILEKVTTTRSSGGPFRLLDLPTELQLAIFNLAIVKPKALRMNLSWPHAHCVLVVFRHHEYPICPWCRSNRVCFPPALARVSRSIRHDALKIFYGQNRFEISLSRIDSVALAKWLGNVGTEYRPLVRMRITAHMPARGRSFFVDQTMARLRKAGWEPVLGRHRDARYLCLTFEAPVE